MSVLHLYALVPDGPDEEAGAGLARETVRLVRVAGVRAAVGALAAPAPVDVASLRGHDRTVRSVAARAGAVLPMRFGQSVPDELVLARVLERAVPRLAAALRLVAGAEQVTLRVAAAPARRDPPPAAPAGSGAGGPGTSYLRERLAAQRRALAPPPELAPLLAAAAPLVRAERVRRSPRDGVLRVHHLVATSDLGAYLELVAGARRVAAPLAVHVGPPGPPYAFAEAVA